MKKESPAKKSGSHFCSQRTHINFHSLPESMTCSDSEEFVSCSDDSPRSHQFVSEGNNDDAFPYIPASGSHQFVSEGNNDDAFPYIPASGSHQFVSEGNDDDAFPYIPASGSHRSLTVLSDHVGSVSCLALCGEFVLSASQSDDIIVWQQPDLRQFTKFGQGDGAVKALVAIGNKVFTAHQDSRIRVWKVSRSTENIFKLVATLPTSKDYLCRFMKQRNYVETRNHRHLWIEHADSISCLAVYNGMVYSGSWDRTLKVWRISDLKCLESIRAHDDAINSLVAHKGVVYSASADGKIKAWRRRKTLHCLRGVLEGHKDVSFNSVIVSEDGRWVYGGGSDGCVIGWVSDLGLENWELVCDLKAHEMPVLCLCSMGEFVCTGSADKSIGIWKREVGGSLSHLGVIRGHGGPIKCLQASSYSVGGGFLLYSGGLDRSLRVWWVSMDHCAKREGEGDTQIRGIEKKCIIMS